MQVITQRRRPASCHSHWPTPLKAYGTDQQECLLNGHAVAYRTQRALADCEHGPIGKIRRIDYCQLRFSRVNENGERGEVTTRSSSGAKAESESRPPAGAGEFQLED